MFDALAAAGITLIVVTFDGYGDSGQIENIEAKAGDAVVYNERYTASEYSQHACSEEAAMGHCYHHALSR